MNLPNFIHELTIHLSFSSRFIAINIMIKLKAVLQFISTNYIFRLIAYWITLFFVFRLSFFVYNYAFLKGSFLHKLYSFLAAIRLDVATAVYLTIPALLFYFIRLFWNKKWISSIQHVINYVLIIFATFVGLLNIALYNYWQSVVNKRILMYMSDPIEVSHYMTLSQIIFSILAIVCFFVFALWLYKKTIKNASINTNSTTAKKAIFSIGLIPLFIVFARGGFQQIPINESSAFYSAHLGNDHAAVNPVYFFSNSVSELFFQHDKYNFFEKNKLSKLKEELFPPCDTSTIKITNHSHPNLVIVILESWTADLLIDSSTSNEITPFVHSLMKESFYFNKCYGSGYRTDQGIVSILAGYPAQPDNSIITYPDKINQLPSLVKHLTKSGYNSSFFYGGDIDFARTKSFVVQQGFKHITDKTNYDKKDYNSKWGAHDNVVFNEQLKHLNGIKEPFVSCILTLSTHEPFEIPVKNKFIGNSLPEKFKSAALFTDQCLKDFFSKAKKEKWYNNTLFLLVGDHGHTLPLKREMNSPEAKRIVCMLTGGALNTALKGKAWNSTIAQHDLIAMLSPYFNYDARKFSFSKDPFTTNKPFAYYANEYVLVMINDTLHSTFEFQTRNEYGPKQSIDLSKAYLQWIYSDFSSK